MKILFVPTAGGNLWGGSEELWTKTCKIALQEGHACLILVNKINKVCNQIRALEKEGAILISKDSIAWFFFKHFFRLHKRLQLKVLRKVIISRIVKPDVDFICISQGGTFNIIWDPLLYNLVHLNNISFFLISQFNYEYQYLSYSQIKRARILFEKAKEIIFVSESNKLNSERQLAQSINNAFLISNPLNLHNYSYIPWPQTAIPIMAVVARLECIVKGQDILLQVLNQPKWKERSWILNLFGTGKDELFLKDLVKFYQLEDKVNFCGQVEDISSIWVNNQILVLPSLGEGTPLALLEALICGRPAIVTNVGGNTEVVYENINGFIAEAPTPKLIDEALDKAWSDRYLWKEMGQRAHDIAIKNFDLNSPKTLLNFMLEKHKTSL